jgi:hypothetical protein
LECGPSTPRWIDNAGADLRVGKTSLECQTTPTDLAILALDITLSVRVKSHRVFSQSLAREMIAPH